MFIKILLPILLCKVAYVFLFLKPFPYKNAKKYLWRIFLVFFFFFFFPPELYFWDFRLEIFLSLGISAVRSVMYVWGYVFQDCDSNFETKWAAADLLSSPQESDSHQSVCVSPGTICSAMSETISDSERLYPPKQIRAWYGVGGQRDQKKIPDIVVCALFFFVYGCVFNKIHASWGRKELFKPPVKCVLSLLQLKEMLCVLWSLEESVHVRLTKDFLPELFDICLARAKERWRSLSTGGSEVENEGIGCGEAGHCSGS
jgi:hypothetical protein